ncbi:MAG: hypothetical protein FWE14_11200 [Lachnospiraceae bacterium]|nr:hypothetical protein [Lachnospiraceae bacterium]
MKSEFEKRLTTLEAELIALKQMNEKLKEQVIEQGQIPGQGQVSGQVHESVPGLTMELMRERILNLRFESRDIQFNQYLTQLMNDMDTGQATLKQVAEEVTRVYQIYLERNKEMAAPEEPHPAEPHIGAKPDGKIAGAEDNTTGINKANGAQGDASGAEYTVGAMIIGIVGAVFLLVGFITFGLNYLTGIWQGIFLYLLSLIIILGSELYIKRKLSKFSYGLTGLGIAALYASTIINYLYMKTIGSITAAVITLIIAGFSFLLSRRKGSAMMRLISFIGCYVCFLLVMRFQNQLEFLVAAGVLFLVNVTSVFLPNQKHSEILHKVHMGLNTVFILTFADLARQGGIMDIYIILCLVLNIVLLNIVSLKQEKDTITTVLFGIETGMFSIMILKILSDLAHPYQLISQQIYYHVLVYMLILAVGIFFYIINRDKWGKIYQYYFLIIFSLLMLIDPVDKEYIWGMLVLFIVVKVFSRLKENEAANAIITFFAFAAGLACKDEWQTWLFLALAILSIPLIKRWRLFYQYTISLYLIIFAALKLPDYNQLILPVAALILFVLVLVFHYFVRPANQKEDNKLQMTYNLTTLGAIALISFFCLTATDNIAKALVTLIGAVSIIMYVNPAFFIMFKKKYLLLAGYLIFMTLVIQFPNPVYASLILMLIAVICVGAGFIIHDKSQRISGLVLAIFVCLKISLYDFQGLEPLQRTIVFAGVGAFALIISLIYIRLEKVGVEKGHGAEYNQLNE